MRDPVLTETAGVINCLVSSGYRVMADSSSGMGCGEGRGPGGLERMKGRERLPALWVLHTCAGAYASVRRCVCAWCEHRSQERPALRDVSAYVC